MNKIGKAIRVIITVFSAAWLILVALHAALVGKMFLFNFTGSIPTFLFVLIPIFFLTWELCRKKKKIIPILIPVLALIIGLTQFDINLRRLKLEAPPGGDYTEIKVFNWNTNCWGQWSLHPDKDYFYTYLKKQNADIYILQEYVNRSLDWSDPEIDKSGLDIDKSTLFRICTTVPGYRLNYMVINDIKRMQEEFPEYYIKANQQFVILSRFPIKDIKEYSGQYVVYDVDIHGKTVRFFNIHIALHVEPSNPLKPRFYEALSRRFIARKMALEEIIEKIENTTTDSIILGDFNSTKALGILDYFMKNHIDTIRYTHKLLPLTFEFWGMRLWRLDYVFLHKNNKNLSVKSFQYNEHEGVSDHLSQSLVCYLKLNHTEKLNAGANPGQKEPERKPAPGITVRQASANGNKEALFNKGNRGLTTVKNDWIYYININTGWNLSRIKTDGSNPEKIDDEFSEFINVEGDWIYYTNCSQTDRIYKIKIDGSQKTKLNNEVSWFLTAENGWLFYVNGIGKICKIKTDGSNRKILCEDVADNINVRDNLIYFINHSDGHTLYRIDTDGENKTRINQDRVADIHVAGDWIYYSNHSDDWKLYKISTTGEKRQKISNDWVSDINMRGDWIYYCNRSDGWRLYKITTAGNGKTRLSEDSAGSINLAGDWIYYKTARDWTLFGRLFRMKTDGSHRMMVN